MQTLILTHAGTDHGPGPSLAALLVAAMMLAASALVAVARSRRRRRPDAADRTAAGTADRKADP